MADVSAAQLRAELAALLQGMSRPKLVLLRRMAIAMNREIEQVVVEADDLFTADFAEAIGDQLLLHHGTHDEPVNKKTFEYVFRNAAEACGHSAVINEQTTDPSEDVRVDDTKFSLKTEAARSQSKTGMNIQKLMEARWIRDRDTPAALARTAATVIPEHLERYERIVLLRGRREADSVAYALVEIPRDLLMLIAELRADDFEPKNRYGGSGADVYRDGVRVFRLFLDGSVEKVRVFSLRIDHCTVRARWRVPLEVAETSDDESILDEAKGLIERLDVLGDEMRTGEE
jgi:Type II site-specific deoxyribonuclease